MSVYFTQECPTCGRSLRIRVAYLGRQVICQHCEGPFEACDPASSGPSTHAGGVDLLRRADELLDTISQQRPLEF